MGRLAVILGSSATGPGGAEVATVAARHALVLQRHGPAGAYVLPHRIDHVANLRSLAEAGRREDCQRIAAIWMSARPRPCSVGAIGGICVQIERV